MRQPLVRRIVLVGACVVAAALPFAPAASGAGNAALDGHIISDPLAGGVSFSQADLSAFAGHLQGVETSITAGSHAKTVVAAKGWHIPGRSGSELYIALVAISDPDLNSAALDTQARLAAKAAASSYCEGATADPPVSDVPVGTIPNSHFVVCEPVSTGVIPTAITTAKANVFAFIFTTQATVTRSKLSSIALRQYGELPTSEVSTAGTSDTSNTGLVVGVIIGAVLVLVGATAVVVFVRRRKIRPPKDAASSDGVAPPPGWYPDPDPAGAGGRRYWTGTQWGPPESAVESQGDTVSAGDEAPSSEATGAGAVNATSDAEPSRDPDLS